MKQIVLLSTAIILFISCKKSSSSSSPSNQDSKYYFNCIVGSDTIALKKQSITDNPLIEMYGQVSTTITIFSSEQECSLPGQICFDFETAIQDQKIGTYNPVVVVLSIIKGADYYTYQYTNGNSNNISFTISKINPETISSNGAIAVGLIEGTFSGKILLRGTSTYAPIKGNFSLPVIN